MVKQAVVTIILLWQVAGAACQRTNPARNKITFKDSVGNVQDSIAALYPLMKKLASASSRMNFFTDDDYFYINSQKVAKQSLLSEPKKLAKTPFFATLSLSEVKKFASLQAYVRSNNIRSFGIASGDRYLFHYLDANHYDDSRHIMLVTGSEDTTNSIFERYQILDRKEDLILIAPVDAKIH